MTQINQSLDFENINHNSNKENKENITIVMDYSNENSMSFKNKNNLIFNSKTTKYKDKDISKNENIMNNNS